MIQRIGIDQIARYPNPDRAQRPQHFLLEHDPAVLEVKA
jgi:hypothetical protein